MIAGIVIGAIVLLILIVCIVGYNSLVKGRIMVDEAFSTMDVYLKKRFDLIPNLVETVKGYAVQRNVRRGKTGKQRRHFTGHTEDHGAG